MSLEKQYKFLQEFKESGLYPETPIIEGTSTKAHVKISGRDIVMFCSNNYLDLANDPEVIERTKIVLKEYGLGPGGSRFLCGNIDIVNQLEVKLADFVGIEDVITFPTGYMANLAVFQGIMDPFYSDKPVPAGSGVIFSDERNHGTIIDGCRLSTAKKVIYEHNDTDDLTEKIEEYSDCENKLIVTESVYSPEGSLGKIKEIVDIADKYKLILMIDDAHGLGILGKNGRGVISHFNLNNKPDIYMASLDKAMGATGGFLGGKKKTIELLRITSRPYLFSSTIPAVAAGSVIASLDLLENDGKRIEDLLNRSSRIRKELKDLGYNIAGDFNSPSIPVVIGDEEKGLTFSKKLFEKGIYSPCFRWPAAPVGKSRIRISLMTSHSDNDIVLLLNYFKEIGKELKII